ncbi:hypothetical protein [Aerococcus loyolae]|uniref:hypothetical protein n=1 Tax=Aerococcus loyolae TaxID=2976809 RepID=UPI00256F1218|nr:hypothetical protein [Aerococcus loyolae]MDL5182480.1 hypothetical protein [Aerococcus loyolae]
MDEESKGNKGTIKCIYSTVTIQLKKLNDKKITLILTERDEFSEFCIFEELLDLSFNDSKLVNKFIEFTENIICLGVSKIRLDEIVHGYFQKYHKKIYEHIKHYHEHQENQELYQYLLYCVFFNEESLFSSEILLNLIDCKTDDLTLVLVFILIYRQNNTDILIDALNSIDQLLNKTHNIYFESKNKYKNPDEDKEETVRFNEKFWFLRYFIYSLIDYEIIDINDYYIKKDIKKDHKKRYQSELNWIYIKSKTANDRTTRFYDYLLSNGVKFVSFGDDLKFKF